MYRSEIYWGGNKRDFYKVYYLLSVILIIISIFSFYLKNDFREYFIISFLSIILGIYFFEAYLTFYSYKKINKDELLFKKQMFKNKFNEDYDTRSKIKFYKDQKKIDNEIKMVFLTSPIKMVKNLLPLSGVSNSRTINCNENGYYSIYNSDRYGFNNPDYEWDQKVTEYLLIGDSFTLGNCVNRPNDLASNLRIFSKKSVLNLGYRGNGPLAEYAALREYMPSNVKKVLWFYYEGNDIQNLKSEIRYEILQNYLKDMSFSQNLRNRQNDINDFANLSFKKAFEEKESNNLLQTKIIKFIKIFKLRLEIKRIVNKKEIDQTFNKKIEIKELFKKVKKLVSDNNSDLYIIYLPEYSRYVSNIDDSNYFLIKKIVAELNLNLIDVHEELFAKTNDPLIFFPFGLHGHYNELGYKKISELVFKKTEN